MYLDNRKDICSSYSQILSWIFCLCQFLQTLLFFYFIYSSFNVFLGFISLSRVLLIVISFILASIFHVLSCTISLACFLKYLYSYFPSHFVFSNLYFLFFFLSLYFCLIFTSLLGTWSVWVSWALHLHDPVFFPKIF